MRRYNTFYSKRSLFAPRLFSFAFLKNTRDSGNPDVLDDLLAKKKPLELQFLASLFCSIVCKETIITRSSERKFEIKFKKNQLSSSLIRTSAWRTSPINDKIFPKEFVKVQDNRTRSGMRDRVSLRHAHPKFRSQLGFSGREKGKSIG